MRLTALGIACGLLAGCGDGTPAGVPVTGKVTAKTPKGVVPAEGAAVSFVPKAAGTPAGGTVSADGSFSLSAVPGEYAVTVRWPKAGKVSIGDSGGEVDQLGGRFSDPKTTTLSATVTAGGPNAFTFEVR